MMGEYVQDSEKYRDSKDQEGLKERPNKIERLNAEERQLTINIDSNGEKNTELSKGLRYIDLSSDKSEAQWLRSEFVALKSLVGLNNLADISEILESRLSSFAFKSLKGMPHPSELLNNVPAAQLIVDTMREGRKIIVVGDYDVDGICATCIMLDFFECVGYENIDFAMPNRFKHGYGFSKKLFFEMIERHPDVSLVITVDNGVSSFEVGMLCYESGISLIITDHHTLEVDSKGRQKIPACDFLINPQQDSCAFPYPDICGSLVAWYLCAAIKIELEPSKQAKEHSIESKESNKVLRREPKPLKIDRTYKNSENIESKSCIATAKIKMQELLLLAGIAIISDVMPLNALNHTICRYTLKNLGRSSKIAVQMLLETLGDTERVCTRFQPSESHASNHNNKITLDSQTLGFKLIPLLNAAGRIDDGSIALRFLRSKNAREARGHFNSLRELNKKRKALQDDVLDRAFDSLKDFVQSPHITFAVGQDWHEGVLGIVAGRMAGELKKPCFVLTNNNGVCKGSARSYGEVDLIASMRTLGHLTNRHGGHVSAVGLEIDFDKIQEFIDNFLPVRCNVLRKQDILGILHPRLLSHELLEIMNAFEPYGNDNPLPKFLLSLEIARFKITKDGFIEFIFNICSFSGEHVCGRENFSNNKHVGEQIKGMFFHKKYRDFAFRIGDVLHFSGTLSVDSQRAIDSQRGVDPQKSFNFQSRLDSQNSRFIESSRVNPHYFDSKESPLESECKDSQKSRDIMIIIDKIHALQRA